MDSSPAGPRIRLGPRFAAVNDVDRDLEEALGLEPEGAEPGSEPGVEKGAGNEAGGSIAGESKGVDEEIDELLSDTEEPGGGKDQTGWQCRWDDCWLHQDSQDILVEHLQTGEPDCSEGEMCWADSA
jgi:hypothetical protein